jgi:hypothetical protein
MRANIVLIAAAVLVAATVGLTLLNHRPTQAADFPKPATEVGRYQLVTERTAAGIPLRRPPAEVWQPFFTEGREWAEHISPPKAK